jgi:hypothetical protein
MRSEWNVQSKCVKKQAPVPQTTVDFNSRRDLESFRKAVEAKRKLSLKTPELVRQSLIDCGIYTPNGKPSKHYR